VCSGEGIGEPDIPNLLTRLVERSLVLVERGEQDRYRLLETLRQYGRDRLIEAGEAEALRDRHRDWFLQLVERAKPEMIGPDQVLWFDRLEADHDNLRAALEWTLEQGPADLGLRLVAAVWRLWFARDYLAEGQDWATRALASPGASEPTLTRAVVLIAASEIMYNLGDRVTWRPLAEAARAIFQTLGDRRGVARSMFMLADSPNNDENEKRFEEMMGEALVVAREAGSEWDIGQIIQHLGFSAQRQGDYPLAQRRLDEAVTIFRRVGDLRAIVVSLEGLGEITCQAGEFASAHAYLEEALTVSRELRSGRHTSQCLDTLGVLAWLEGNYEQSRAFLEEGISLARRVGDRDSTGTLLFHLGLLARAQRDPARAEALFRDSVSISVEHSSSELGNRAAAIRFCGILAIDRGSHQHGLRLLGTVDRQTTGRWWLGKDDLRAYEDALTTARASLGDDEFARAWAEGQALTLEQAVAYELDETAQVGSQ
jgi:tetratricopeptide (TPR) repeat protein